MDLFGPKGRGQHSKITGNPERPAPKNSKFSGNTQQLNFLKPCEICGGTRFTYTGTGTFHCKNCKPGIAGIDVIAGRAIRQHDNVSKEKHLAPSQPKLSTAEKRILCASYHFESGYIWIMANLDSLKQHGWTSADLFRRSKYRYPLGNWGIAWLSIWSKNIANIKINHRGQIVFTFKELDRTITQTASQKK